MHYTKPGRVQKALFLIEAGLFSCLPRLRPILDYSRLPPVMCRQTHITFSKPFNPFPTSIIQPGPFLLRSFFSFLLLLDRAFSFSFFSFSFLLFLFLFLLFLLFLLLLFLFLLLLPFSLTLGLLFCSPRLTTPDRLVQFMV